MPKKQVIVGTAGHVDHGKTSLVYKLTGIDADRWKEEKLRGITIDIGFAHMDAEDISVSFIDVPGHKDFVTNMLAGVHSIDFAILVIAADESVMPQTKEHFDILNLLGIEHIFPVITKIDLVDEDMLSLVQLEVEELFEKADRKIERLFKVSSVRGDGIDEFKNFLFNFARKIENFNSIRPAFINIDRSFIIKGYGTVITGTLMAGEFRVNDEITILPLRKSGKIRNINTHGEKTEIISAKKRAALNLPDFKKEEIKRGNIAIKDNIDITTQIIDAKIKVIGGYSSFKDLTRVRVSIGTEDAIARVKLLDGKEKKVPFETYCQLRFEEPIACYTGEKFILRHFSPLFTVGGGVVLDNKPGKRKGYKGVDFLKEKDSEDFEKILLAIVKEEGMVGLKELRERLFINENHFKNLINKLKNSGRIIVLKNAEAVLSFDYYSILTEKLTQRVREFQENNPRKQGIPYAYFSDSEKYVLDSLIAKKKLIKNGEVIHTPDFKSKLSVDENREFDKLISLLEKGGLTPPMMNVLSAEFKDKALLKDLLKRGVEENKIVRINADFYLATGFYNEFLNKFRSFAKKKTEFSLQEIKPVFNISRRYLVALLEHLDGESITVKIGEKRKVIK
ncbi:selenocysteine-specific elongation factor [Thermotomaculum hydrothermale]|uniref:Selenocysteine-specific elongation factor n=1 Tax=Thermotomaculum hydrothermale TaxID=981385 RepID=A0A7R6SYZ0_9BACT|nr:selenocysteine-specific translation elongation factor [Thermotomaculum hydrothermale]BBB33091.1 selenocysteine-specific elongation factor [Thermotomaculum hydrothermale]